MFAAAHREFGIAGGEWPFICRTLAAIFESSLRSIPARDPEKRALDFGQDHAQAK
jgi:hypothetical protein